MQMIQWEIIYWQIIKWHIIQWVMLQSHMIYWQYSTHVLAESTFASPSLHTTFTSAEMQGMLNSFRDLPSVVGASLSVGAFLSIQFNYASVAQQVPF